MPRYDRLCSGLWILFGLGEGIQAWMLGLGTISEPEGGFMPFGVGMGIILLAGVLTSGLSYLIFGTWLKVSFSPGILSF